LPRAGLTGGWVFTLKLAKYCYNFYGIERYYVEGANKISAGKHEVRMEFAYDGADLRKAARLLSTSTAKNVVRPV
jgi:hypothetical protein